MKTSFWVAASMSLLPLGVGSQAAVQPRVTDYCLVEAVTGDTGNGKSIRLGNFEMRARLTLSGSHYFLKAWNRMPDNPQLLEFEADGTYQQHGPTRIRFIDGFDNRGRGSFTATASEMHIDIERVKTAPGGENIGRNYGPNTLRSRGCKWDAP
jgi:hypothetical protein